MSEKSDLDVVTAQITEGEFQKESLNPININNFKNLPSAGKSNSQSDDQEILRQCSSEIINSDLILINEKCNSVAVRNNNISPSPKLRRRLSVYGVSFTSSSSNKCKNTSSVVNAVGDQKDPQIKISEGGNKNHKKVNAHKISKTNSVPPPPPLQLQSIPMPPANTKSTSGVTFPVAEPKVIKKGDTVIKSYVDEKTGKISVYEPGIKLEVSHPESGLWYPAKVKQVDLKEAEILIHYEKWSSRFDEWIKMDSPRLRPSANTNVVKVEFKVGEKVEAIWNTDGQRYPGVIIQVFPQQDYYEVQFDDGIKCKKKSNQIFKIKRCRSRPSVETGSSSVETSPSSSQKSVDCSSNSVPSNVNVSPVPWDNSALSEQEQKVDTVLDSQSPLQTTSQIRTPPVHFSIFTPPSGELGKRKRTIQDYSALLKRPTKSFSVENDETVPLGDSAVIPPPTRKKKQISSEVSIVKPIVENNNVTSCQINTPTEVLNSETSIVNSSPAIKVEPIQTTDTVGLPAKRIRKPSRRWSTFSDEEYSASPDSKKVKTKIPRKFANSHAGISDEIKKEPTFPTFKETLGIDESVNGVCTGKSPNASVIRSPSIMDTNSEDSSDTSDEKLVNAISNSEGSNLVSALKARRRGRIQFRTKIPSDLANLEIPPPPASGYRLKKLYLEIDKVNDVNIEQVVSDPEGIIFKLNDPVPEGWRKEAQLKFRNETYPKWFISYVSPAGDRFRYLKQMHKLIQEANFDFTPFDFRPLNPRLQEIAKMVSGGHYSYKRRTNMPPPPLLSELETSPGVGVAAIVPKPTRRQSVQVVRQQSPMSPSVPADSKIDSGFVDAEGNDVTIEQGEDGGWACPAQGCDKHFRKDSLLQMHFKHYHPEMKVKSRGGVKIANVVEMAKARTAFDYDEPNPNAPKVLPSPSEPDIILPSPLPITSSSVSAETVNVKSLCKRSRGTELRDKEATPEKTEMPSNAENESSVENPDRKDQPADPVDNGIEEERIPEDTYTDAVEISATDYKRPRINLRRKFLSKRHNLYRLPIRTSLKFDSFSAKKELKVNKVKEVPSVNQRTNGDSSKMHTMPAELQIIVEKCDSVSDNASKVSPVSSELPVKEVNEPVISSSLGTSLRARINGIQNNSVLKSIRRREKRKATSLQVQRARNFVKNRRGRGRGRPRIRKPVGYFSGLSRKQVCRIRREIVDKSIPIRFLGDPKLKDVKVDIINCICNGLDEFGMMVQCELCHCWQHGNCFGFYEDEDLPKYYVCESCRNPGNPSATRFWEWQVQGYYKTGHLPSLCNTSIPNYNNSRVRAQCIEVKNWILSTVNCIENCNFKLRIAQKKPDHPKLYHWEHPTENPLREKQIHDFRRTYKPWFYRRLKVLHANDVDYKKSMRKSYLKHLYWKKFQTLVDDFKWGIRNLDAKFLIILNKLSIYQRWRVRNKMEEKRRLNLVDKETPYTNPFAIWARKRRQRQQWESKMKRHAGILEKEKCLEEVLFKLELAKSSSTKVERQASNNTNEFHKSIVLNPLDRLKNVGSGNVRDNVFPTGEMKFSFCTRCRTSAFKLWDWSDFAKNGDEFFEKNIQETSSKKNSNKVYKPSTLKSLCEMVVASLKSNKELSFSGSDRDVKSENLFDYCNIAENLEASKETRPLVDDFNCSDTTESIDCEDCPGDKEIPANLDEECIRCYLISVSLSKDTNYSTFSCGLSGLRNYQSEWEKFSAVNYRDILTFLGLADVFRQGIWDSVENTLPNIPVSRRTCPIINRHERISSQRIILHYNSELRRYWKRMFNIRLRGLDLTMQKQTWVDELVRLYSEIHLLLEDMLKVVDESSQVDKLGEVLLRKIDIFRSICGTPDSGPSDNLITTGEIFNEIDDAKSFMTGVQKAADKASSSKEANSRPTETAVRQNSNSPEKRFNSNQPKDAEESIVDIVESCILKIESAEVSDVDMEKGTDHFMETEKATSSKSESKNNGHQSHHPSIKKDEEFVIPNTEAKSEKLLNPNQNFTSNGPVSFNTSSSTTSNTETTSPQVKKGSSCSTIETDTVLPSILSDDLVIDSLPDFDVTDVDISMDIFNDPAFMEPPQKRLKQTLVPKIRGPFLKKLTAESCRDNLLENILKQQELIDSYLDKLEEKVCELERKYTKRKVDPMSSKKWVQVVQMMIFYSNKLQFLKTNAELLCGGTKGNAAVSDGESEANVEEPSVGNSNISDHNSDLKPDRF